MNQFKHFFYDYLIGAGLSERLSEYLNMAALLLISVFIILLTDRLIKIILIHFFVKMSQKTKTNFDDILIQNKFLRNLAHIIPVLIALELIPVIFTDFGFFESILETIIKIIFVLLLLRIARSFFNTIKDYLRTLPRYKDKPIESYVQVIMIFLWVVGLSTIIAIITHIEVIDFLKGLGAASAVLLLIFKDTILGFVASIQVTINDMVRIGDWITFEKFGADGNVTEINLATVKVQNFDKTITTIPTYALISDSFKNWRGMERSGGRRIKRALTIKLNSVKYLTAKDAEKFKNIQLIRSYLEKRIKNIEQYNTNHKIEKELLINGRNLTNLGVFRKYVETYVENHSAINKEMMIMTRQLAPTTQGIPIEIYAFSSDKRWENYEYIMADIFDHVIASVPYFDLEIFELPDNSILKELLKKEG